MTQFLSEHWRDNDTEEQSEWKREHKILKIKKRIKPNNQTPFNNSLIISNYGWLIYLYLKKGD